MIDLNPDALRAIAARLQQATGPDRELDEALMALVYIRDSRHIGTRENDGSGWKPVRDMVWVDPETDKWVSTVAHFFTSSQDDAATFRERLLPGWDWSVRNATSRRADGEDRFCVAVVWPPLAEEPHPFATAPDGQPALAMVAATIAARIDKA